MATHSSTAAVGTAAPRFSLPDQAGNVVALDDALTQGPVVLVFLRGFL